MTFDQRIIDPLHELAGELLEKRQYARLATVAHYISTLSGGQWNRLGSEKRVLFVEKMASDFHPRAWDDWDWDATGAFSRVADMINLQGRVAP